MLKSSIHAAVAVVVLAIAMPVLAQAQPGRAGGHHDPLLAGVTLTDNQKSQLEALRKSSWKTAKPLFDQVRTLDQQIDTALLSSGSVTEATVAPLVQKKQALLQQLDADRLSHEFAIRNLLTEAQLATAATTHAQLASLHEQERKLHGDLVAPDGPPPTDN